MQLPVNVPRIVLLPEFLSSREYKHLEWLVRLLKRAYPSYVHVGAEMPSGEFHRCPVPAGRQGSAPPPSS